MSAQQLARLTPKQREWIDRHLGTNMRIGGHGDNGNQKVTGRVVDYKLDLGGRGVYFVIDLGPDCGKRERWHERYRALPGSWQTGPRT